MHTAADDRLPDFGGGQAAAPIRRIRAAQQRCAAGDRPAVLLERDADPVGVEGISAENERWRVFVFGALPRLHLVPDDLVAEHVGEGDGQPRAGTDRSGRRHGEFEFRVRAVRPVAGDVAAEGGEPERFAAERLPVDERRFGFYCVDPECGRAVGAAVHDEQDLFQRQERSGGGRLLAAPLLRPLAVCEVERQGSMRIGRQPGAGGLETPVRSVDHTDLRFQLPVRHDPETEFFDSGRQFGLVDAGGVPAVLRELGADRHFAGGRIDRGFSARSREFGSGVEAPVRGRGGRVEDRAAAAKAEAGGGDGRDQGQSENGFHDKPLSRLNITEYRNRCADRTSCRRGTSSGRKFRRR